MSYGKWKALQPLVQVEAAPRVAIESERVCEICGREILARGTSMRKGEKKSCGCQGRGLGKLYDDQELWTKASAGKLRNCQYQENVDCEDRNCANCGWNPEVAKARSRKILARLRNGKRG